MSNKYLISILFASLIASTHLSGQELNPGEIQKLRQIHRHIYLSGDCHQWLKGLTQIGGRLAGSPAADSAIRYVYKILDTLPEVSVRLQPCSIPNYWVRGPMEEVIVYAGDKPLSLDCSTLGGSPSTPAEGITAVVQEVYGLEDLERLGRQALEGSIVFFNRPMDAGEVSPFRAYGQAVDQRVRGPAMAARYGAVGAIVRSMTHFLDDVPHTGVTIFRDGEKAIPAIAISTLDADSLSSLIRQRGSVMARIRTSSKNLGPRLSYNVIGEITGSTFPNQIIVVGGHLDAWDNGEGAHDDGAGIVQALQVLQTLVAINYTPRHTIRFVAYMNEENGGGGARAYADSVRINGETHIAAIESDAGGFAPVGFHWDAQPHLQPYYDSLLQQIIAPHLLQLDLLLRKGGSGADVSKLKPFGTLLFGLRPQPHQYFKYHHTPIDVFDAVHPRELKAGAAAMTSLVYLLDRYLTPPNTPTNE